jgi:putative DNA primase/helicase
MTPDQEPPPIEEEYPPSVVPIGAQVLNGIGNDIDSIGRLLENPTHRAMLTGSAEPLRWNEAAMLITQGGATVELKTFVTAIRRQALAQILVPAKKPGEFTPLRLPREDVADAVLEVARKDSYDPVVEYLQGLSGWPRHYSAIDLVAADGLHLPEGFDRRIIRKWAISAVARALVPACKVDTVLVLVGDQGVGKSSFFSAMGGEWFSDTPMDMASKDRFQQLHGTWIYEWSELSSIRMADLEDIKAFITSQDDRFRASYAAETLSHKRRGIIVGSTNTPQFLRDPTGDRRFWPVTIREPIDLELIKSERDNFWAEALEEFELGTPWHDDPRDAIELAQRHAAHREQDVWEPMVEGWACGWAGLLTVRTALVDCLHVDPGKISRADQMRMASVFAALGYKKQRERVEGKREYVWSKTVPCPTLS